MGKENDFMHDYLPHYQYYQDPYYMPPYQYEQMNPYFHPYPSERCMYYMSYCPYADPNKVNEHNHNDETTTNMILQQFMDEQGQVDITKMLKTIGQLADTVQQVTPVVKQINDIIKAFRV